MKRKVAIIDEDNCVGCSKCTNICPIDAIVGSSNMTHRILIESCIGCNMCIDICPTDCIQIKDRLFINYVVKKIDINEINIKTEDIKKNKLMINAKNSYKNKVLRLKCENIKNLCFYDNKKRFLNNIKKEIKQIIVFKKFL